MLSCVPCTAISARTLPALAVLPSRRASFVGCCSSSSSGPFFLWYRQERESVVRKNGVFQQPRRVRKWPCHLFNDSSAKKGAWLACKFSAFQSFAYKIHSNAGCQTRRRCIAVYRSHGSNREMHTGAETI